MDKEVEHDNLAFKTDIHSYHGEITDKSIASMALTSVLKFGSHLESTPKCKQRVISVHWLSSFWKQTCIERSQGESTLLSQK